MSDQAPPITLPDDERAPRPPGIYEHYCEHPHGGGWGFARGKQQTEWFCYEQTGATAA